MDVMAEALTVKERTISISNELVDERVQNKHVGHVIPLVTEDHVLEGLVDHVEAYYEVPVQGIKDNNYIHLSLKYSNLLLKGSTLSVYVDEVPIKSLSLDTNKTSMQVKIPLEDHAIEAGFHNVSISFYGHVEENICVNEENPANWLAVLSESTIHLQPKDVEVREDALSNYPFPYVQKNMDNEIQSKIVIPNEASENILAASLKVSNYLHKQAALPRPVEIVKEKDLDKISSHIIAIGSIDEWDGMIKNVLGLANVNVESNEFSLQTFFMDFSNITKQLLLVTAKDDETIDQYISMVTDDFFVEQLSGNELSINELPAKKEREQNNKITLTEFNMSDLSLSGINQASFHYFYTIPTFVDKSQHATLHLKMKVAETLFVREALNDAKDEAELVVYINEEPHSIRINDLDKTVDNGLYEAEIRVDSNVFKNDPYISVQFQANGLHKQDYCAKPTNTNWIYIQEDSYIEFGMQTNGEKESFRTWPSPFVATNGKVETAIMLPNKLDDSFIKQLQLLIHQLGANANIDDVHLIKESDVDDDILMDNNIIVLADEEVYTKLFADNENALLKVNGQNSLQMKDFGFINETARNVAWIQPSIWNNEKAMAVFIPVHLNETTPIIGENIIHFLNNNIEFANIIVEHANGEIFTNELEEQEEGSEKITDNNIFIKEIESNRWIPYGFGGIIVVSIIIFFIAIRRRKKKRTGKE